MAKLWPGHDSGIHKHTDRVNSICPSAILWWGHKNSNCDLDLRPTKLKCRFLKDIVILHICVILYQNQSINNGTRGMIKFF